MIDKFVSRFDEIEVNFNEKMMNIDNTIDQKVTTAVEKVSKKLEEQILVNQTKSEDQNNCIIEISRALSKFKATLQEVTLLADGIQTLETLLQARENDQSRQEAYNNRLNLLIQGLSESKDAGESKKQTKF